MRLVGRARTFRPLESSKKHSECIQTCPHFCQVITLIHPHTFCNYCLVKITHFVFQNVSFGRFLRRIVKFKYKNDTKTTINMRQNMHKVTKCYNSHTILNKSHQKWLIFRFFPSFSIFSYIFVCFCHFFYTFANVKRAQR